MKNKEEKSKEGRHERYTYRAKREAAKDAPLIWKGGIDVIMDRIQEFFREESFLYVHVREWEGLKNEDADNTFILILKFTIEIIKFGMRMHARQCIKKNSVPQVKQSCRGSNLSRKIKQIHTDFLRG
ncbi:hypothetical protein ACB098_10G041600 [Castanea mollissima]